MKSARATKALASRLGLDFADKRDLRLPAPLRIDPIARHAARGTRLAMTGTWRGHRAHRLVVGDYVLEALELPASLPTLVLVPADRPALEVSEARPSGVGDIEFDMRWHVVASDLRLVAELAASPAREVLMHEASRGASITFDGPLVYLWRDLDDAVLADTQNRFDLLTILLSRIPADLWSRYGMPVAQAPAAPVAPAPVAAAPAPAPVAVAPTFMPQPAAQAPVAPQFAPQPPAPQAPAVHAPAPTFAPAAAFQPEPDDEEASYLSAGFHSQGGDPYAAPVSHVPGAATPPLGVPAAPVAPPTPGFVPPPAMQAPPAQAQFQAQPAFSPEAPAASGTFAPAPAQAAPAVPSPAFPGAPAPTGTFAPTPAGSFSPDSSMAFDDGPGWIGGDDQNDLYWSTGPRIRGQARMRG